MLFDEKKKRLFDEAYSAYLNITRALEELYSGIIHNPFDEDHPSVTDLVCSLDMFLQGVLLKIAVSDGELAEAELNFIMSLPDELDEVCARNRGYRRFLKKVSVDNYQENATIYYNTNDIPYFLKILQSENEDAVEGVIESIEKILCAFVAIDDIISECENEIVANTILFLKNNCITNRSTQTSCRKIIDNISYKKEHHFDSELDQVLNELNELIGLTEVKREVMTCISLLKINNMRKEKGLPELQISNHMVFTGNPGTGKTTVARIMSKIYKALGVVSKGHLVETDRSGMVAGFVGQTALKTAEVLRKAKGGVLFIDEAYSLISENGSNDYGKEAVDTLVKGMEDYRDDLVVIVAGYTEEMERFINMNPGLRSRFNKYINFNNYDEVEMLSIFRCMCDKAKFIVSPQAESIILDYFKKHQDDDSFGNARGVRNFFDHIVMAQANRIVALDNPSEEEFRTILEEDALIIN